MALLGGLSDETLKGMADFAIPATFVLALASAIVGAVAGVAGGETGRRSEVAIKAADVKAAQALADAATANQQAETLRNANLQLATDLEREKIERLKLLQATAPRILDAPEREKLVAAFKGTGLKIRIFAESDMEAEGLARDFIDAFKAAGVEVDFQTIGSTPPFSYGIAYYDPNGPKGVFGSRMIGIFTEAGWRADEPFADQTAAHGFDRRPTLEIRFRPIRTAGWRPLKTGRQ